MRRTKLWIKSVKIKESNDKESFKQISEIILSSFGEAGKERISSNNYLDLEKPERDTPSPMGVEKEDGARNN